MVDQQEFDDGFSGINHLRGSYILNDHAICHRGPARGNQFGHRPRIPGRTLGDLHQAGSALAAGILQFGIITHGRRYYGTSDQAGCLQNGGPFFYLYRVIINCDLQHLKCYIIFFVH